MLLGIDASDELGITLETVYGEVLGTKDRVKLGATNDT